MKTLVAVLFVISVVLLSGCDSMAPDHESTARLVDASALQYQTLQSSKPKAHTIRYIVTDGAFSPSNGFVGATIGYTSGEGGVQVNGAGLPWTTTESINSGTPVELSALFSSPRGPLTVSIYQDGRLLVSRSAANGEASVSVSAMIE